MSDETPTVLGQPMRHYAPTDCWYSCHPDPIQTINARAMYAVSIGHCCHREGYTCTIYIGRFHMWSWQGEHETPQAAADRATEWLRAKEAEAVEFWDAKFRPSHREAP